jgi:hypothetical protein
MMNLAPIPIHRVEPAVGDVDFNTQAGADILARRIRAFWLNQGYDVRVHVRVESVERSRGKKEPAFRVVTDMVAGTPKRRIPGMARVR